jgi:glycosyltransferase involved in cell wall biosynthesis
MKAIKDIEVTEIAINKVNVNSIKLDNEYDVFINHTAPSNVINDFKSNGFMKSAALRCKKKYQYALWEADPIPHSHNMEFRLMGFNGFICPSRFVRDLYARTGLETVYIPISPDVKNKKVNVDSDVFTVLTVAQLSTRKGLDVSVRAFQHAFAGVQNVRYIIKLGEKIDNFDFANFIKNEINEAMIPNPAPVYFIDRHLSSDEIEDLFVNSSCYLHLSRGEGFGMTPLNAMDYGIPVVYSDWSAHTEFLKKSKGSIPVSGLMDFVHGMDGRYGFNNKMKWFEPGIIEASAALSSLYVRWIKSRKTYFENNDLSAYSEEAVIEMIVKFFGLTGSEIVKYARKISL